MLPYIHIIRRDVPVYGLMMMIGAALGWMLCVHRARRVAPFMSRECVTRICIFFGAGALIGAKVYSLLLVWPYFVRDLPHFWENPQLFLERYVYGGLVFYGGLIGGFVCVAYLLISHKASFATLELVYLPAVPLVHGIGRIGCFCAGCCYGVPTESGFGVCYPEGGLAPSGVPLVPVQLFEAAGDLLLCGILCLPLYRQTGRRLSVYLICYGCLRFGIECFRGDAVRGFVGRLSGAQWISLICVVTGVLINALLLVKNMRCHTNDSVH